MEGKRCFQSFGFKTPLCYEMSTLSKVDVQVGQTDEDAPAVFITLMDAEGNMRGGVALSVPDWRALKDSVDAALITMLMRQGKKISI